MNICLELSNPKIDGPILLEQRADKSFRVTYGKQVRDRLNYSDAAHELGECVLHALACMGKLDNSGEA